MGISFLLFSVRSNSFSGTWELRIFNSWNPLININITCYLIVVTKRSNYTNWLLLRKMKDSGKLFCRIASWSSIGIPTGGTGKNYNWLQVMRFVKLDSLQGPNHYKKKKRKLHQVRRSGLKTSHTFRPPLFRKAPTKSEVFSGLPLWRKPRAPMRV